jgi:hypothetical protein
VEEIQQQSSYQPLTQGRKHIFVYIEIIKIKGEVTVLTASHKALWKL